MSILYLSFFFEICPWLIERGATWAGIIYNGDNKIVYVFIANFLASLVTLLLLLPAYFKIKLEFDLVLLRKMLVYALPLVLSGIAGIVNQFIGLPFLKALASNDLEYNKAQMGIFSAGSKIAVLLNLFTQAFNYAAEPFFFRNADRADAKVMYAQVAQAFVLVGSIAFLTIMLYMDLIQYFIGRDFREGLGIAPILLIANLLLGLYYSVSIWFKLSDKTNVGGYIAIGGSILTIIINFVFIPIIGYYAPAWAALACYGFMLAMCYWLGQRNYPIDYPVGRILGYILIAVGFYGVSLLTNNLLPEILWLRVLFNTLLLGVYLFILYRMEKNGFLRVLRGKSSEL